MRILLSILTAGWAAAAPAAVWVGYEGGLRHYTNEGELVRDYREYKRPISLLYDAERKRLWFLDAFDYKLVCFDAEAGREILNVRNAAHAPSIGTSDLGVYLLEKKPFEPSLALDVKDGSVWVADFYGHEVAKYDEDGKELFRSAAFHEPFAVAVLGDCSAWVAGGIRTLSLVGPQCNTLQTMTGVNEARDLAVDTERDLVWVADYRNNRIFAINRDGRLKRRVTGIELPERLAVDSERGTVWVATSYAGIVKISADAEKITASIPEPGSIAALAVAGDGKLWVAYYETEEIVCFSPAGAELAKIKRVNGPTGVAAD
jgi:outer membrane protein assembly factor BamB